MIIGELHESGDEEGVKGKKFETCIKFHALSRKYQSKVGCVRKRSREIEKILNHSREHVVKLLGERNKLLLRLLCCVSWKNCIS